MGNLSSDNNNESLFIDINVTPLVDVMLVLLIIFMVATPFMMDNISVSLPQGEGLNNEGLASPFVITIDKSENIIIDKQKISLSDLKAFLNQNPQTKSQEGIYIEADESIRHRVLVAVMSSAYLAGANKINIMMEKPQQ